MNDLPERVSLIRQWVEKAEEDFRTAEYTLTMPENCPYGTICFHAQQCVEKYIKALLVRRSIEFPPESTTLANWSRSFPKRIRFPSPRRNRKS